MNYPSPVRKVLKILSRVGVLSALVITLAKTANAQTDNYFAFLPIVTNPKIEVANCLWTMVNYDQNPITVSARLNLADQNQALIWGVSYGVNVIPRDGVGGSRAYFVQTIHSSYEQPVQLASNNPNDPIVINPTDVVNVSANGGMKDTVDGSVTHNITRYSLFNPGEAIGSGQDEIPAGFSGQACNNSGSVLTNSETRSTN